MKEQLTFSYWKERCRNGGTWIDMPRTKEIQPSTRFVFRLSCAPMPCCAECSEWVWSNDPDELAGLIRFVLVPMHAALWLDEEERDEATGALRPVEEMFASHLEAEGLEKDDLAGHGLDEDSDDVSFLRTLVARSDDGLRSEDPAVRWDALESACQSFTERYGCTSGWNLILKSFPSLGAAVEDRLSSLRDDDGESEIDEEAFRQTVAQVEENEKAREAVWDFFAEVE